MFLAVIATAVEVAFINHKTKNPTDAEISTEAVPRSEDITFNIVTVTEDQKPETTTEEKHGFLTNFLVVTIILMTTIVKMKKTEQQIKRLRLNQRIKSFLAVSEKLTLICGLLTNKASNLHFRFIGQNFQLR